MTEAVEKGLKKIGITVSKPILAMICIIFGILVIVFPDLLEWIVGLFLIIQGVLLLTDYLELRGKQSNPEINPTTPFLRRTKHQQISCIVSIV